MTKYFKIINKELCNRYKYFGVTDLHISGQLHKFKSSKYFLFVPTSISTFVPTSKLIHNFLKNGSKEPCEKIILEIYDLNFLVEIACCNGLVDFLDKEVDFVIPLFRSEQIYKFIKLACKNGHTNVLDWIKSHVFIEFFCDIDCLELVFQNGHIDVLEWLKKYTSNFHISLDKHFIQLTEIACTYGRVNVMQWCKINGKKVLYNESHLYLISYYGHSDFLEWWKKTDPYFFDLLGTRCIGLLISHSIIYGHLNILKWLQINNINFFLCDYHSEIALYRGHEHIVKWIKHNNK